MTVPAAGAPADVYIGLMSGTSLDGISAAAVRFAACGAPPGSWLGEPDLLGFCTHPYAQRDRQRLERAIHEGATTAEWCQLGFDMGTWLAAAAVAVLAESGVARSSVRAIGSHGQTVWHEPGRSTWQIGESAVIAERTGLDVISDFRVRDIAAGGQGAPLVSIADVLLFSPPAGWRALQNVGGIGNVTIVASGRSLAGVRAFDTGPGVVVIDGVVRTLRPALPYDVDGQLARRGQVIAGVVGALLADPYFAAPPPKSTGRELFDARYIAGFIERCRSASPAATTEDIVATAVSLTARSIADAYARFVPEPVGDVLLSGGGARNPALAAAIAEALAPRGVRPFADVYFDGEAKEAVAFALLAALHIQGRAGNVPAATGASGPRILGKLTPAGDAGDATLPGPS
jgi:anhydro-N-acetylmuramic acid kinase